MKKIKGLTLIETMLTIAVIAVLMTAIIMFYLSVKTSREVLSETDNINRIMARMEKFFKNNEALQKASDTDLTRFIASQKGFENMRVEDGLINGWGGIVGISNTAGVNRYSVIYHEVPYDACLEIVPNFMNKVKELKVNDQSFKDKDVTQLTEICVEGHNKIEISPH